MIQLAKTLGLSLEFAKKNQNRDWFRKVKILGFGLPWSNAFWSGLTPFCPLLWEAEADTEAKRHYSTVTATAQGTINDTAPRNESY